MSLKKPHIVIVGAGFAGLKLAEQLSKNDHFTVTLVSERDDFWYFPSLYHTATGAPSELSSIPLTQLLAGSTVKIVTKRAVALDRDASTLKLADGTSLTYDKLVLGLGVVTNYFGIKGLPEYSYGIKSIQEAEVLKAHIHTQLLDDQKPDLNYIVVGGGPTGIELAAQLPSYIHQIMESHGLKPRKVQIDLVEGAPHLLPRMPRAVGRAVERQLRRLGIKLYLGTVVKGESADELMLGDKSLQSHTVVWTAGQANNPFFAENNFTLSDHKKVVVNQYLEAEPNIYVVGDNAETPYSGMAQTAVYDADFVARNLEFENAGKPRQRYQAKKPVYVIPAGPHWAAVEWGKFHTYGRLGWLLREAGDIKGFLDIETPIKASQQWLKEFQSDKNCPDCQPHRTKLGKQG